MADRVVTTSTAQDSINEIQRILNGNLADTMTSLDRQGQTLSDPNVWDGPLARDFRATVWPAVDKSLQDTKQKLDDLRNQLQRIHDDIWRAGGH